ncbi:hypothetical protein RHMOL_Rhmol05G0324500 [Rhododendron molle]|uniref:Uncharacterized protein n=1 Tax=Rhododendron molle TaxID=49168 RepID=A0ACC0NWX7_RHOML|nr:hypothetical protein RHMOL_Rhmol05G0324500 [Rhododendron molle]
MYEGVSYLSFPQMPLSVASNLYPTPHLFPAVTMQHPKNFTRQNHKRLSWPLQVISAHPSPLPNRYSTTLPTILPYKTTTASPGPPKKHYSFPPSARVFHNRRRQPTTKASNYVQQHIRVNSKASQQKFKTVTFWC